MTDFDNRIKLSRNWSLSKDRLFQITSFVVYRGLFEFILGRFKTYFDVLHCFGDKLVDFYSNLDKLSNFSHYWC